MTQNLCLCQAPDSFIWPASCAKKRKNSARLGLSRTVQQLALQLDFPNLHRPLDLSWRKDVIGEVDDSLSPLKFTV